jgi:hypothetical protein
MHIAKSFLCFLCLCFLCFCPFLNIKLCFLLNLQLCFLCFCPFLNIKLVKLSHWRTQALRLQGRGERSVPRRWRCQQRRVPRQQQQRFWEASRLRMVSPTLIPRPNGAQAAVGEGGQEEEERLRRITPEKSYFWVLTGAARSDQIHPKSNF